MNVSDFIRHHYRHFNAAALKDAADAYRAHVDGGGQMMVTLAGAMSTAELGLSLAEMIRAATHVPKKRVKTKPTLGSKLRRLDGKAKRGDVKKLRSSRPDHD